MKSETHTAVRAQSLAWHNCPSASKAQFMDRAVCWKVNRRSNGSVCRASDAPATAFLAPLSFVGGSPGGPVAQGRSSTWPEPHSSPINVPSDFFLPNACYLDEQVHGQICSS